ncbi:MAG TPA: S1 RNA-binding domain-containing protein [Actinomycetota bacterium]|nr:S1 RNA-binding domain-containing protein [Actinomycetota bacterium]
MAEVGAVVEATVEKVMDYGAFVRLETGETGMVHISEIDKNYVKDIRDHVRENDKVQVKVIGQKEDGKIDLSIKQAEPGYEDRPRRSGKDPDFERKLKKFMSQSQERLVDLKRHKEGKR